jgi:hypothetical protein
MGIAKIVCSPCNKRMRFSENAQFCGKITVNEEKKSIVPPFPIDRNGKIMYNKSIDMKES